MTDKRRTAREIAYDLMTYGPMPIDDMVNMVAKTLEDYAEQRVSDDRNIRTSDDLYKRSRELGRNEGIEEVRQEIAKMLDTFPLDPKIAAIAINIKKIIESLKRCGR